MAACSAVATICIARDQLSRLFEHLTTPRNYAPRSTKGDDKMISHHDATRRWPR
jgi:hypothetical protein